MTKRINSFGRTIIIVLLIIFFVAFILRAYISKWDWTGFSESTTITSVKTSPIAIPTDLIQTIDPTSNILDITYRIDPHKTLWDWMGLLIIPAVLASGIAWFNRQQRRNEQEKAEKRKELEDRLEDNRQREDALQKYLEQIKNLLLKEHLTRSREGDEVRGLAQILTSVTMKQLDGRRNEILLRFLDSAGLIAGIRPVIDLKRVDLREIDLSQASLFKFNLSGILLNRANLERATMWGGKLNATLLYKANMKSVGLWGADLVNAQMRGADLRGADLRGADLRNADLSEANLEDARLNGADLKGANLRGANMTFSTDLSGADLRGADLTLPTIKLSRLISGFLLGPTLNGALYNNDTEWPDMGYYLRYFGIGGKKAINCGDDQSINFERRLLAKFIVPPEAMDWEEIEEIMEAVDNNGISVDEESNMDTRSDAESNASNVTIVTSLIVVCALILFAILKIYGLFQKRLSESTETI